MQDIGREDGYTRYLRRSANFVQAGQAAPLLSWGVLDKNGQNACDPYFPDLPHIGEAYKIVHGKKLSGIEWNAFMAFLIWGFPAHKLHLLPKGTSDELVEAYRAAVREMLKNPGYIARPDEIIGEYEQVTEAQAAKLYKDGTTISPEARN